MTNLSAISAKNPILLMGCGKMGSAMLAGWLEQGLDTGAIYIVDPFLEPIRNTFSKLKDNHLHESVKSLPAKISPSFIIMAVKPQMMV